MFIFRICFVLIINVFVQESANATVELARETFPDVECKWGEEGLDEIINDSSITAVAVVLAGQFQVYH